jgi:hypothetical protein
VEIKPPVGSLEAVHAKAGWLVMLRVGDEKHCLVNLQGDW